MGGWLPRGDLALESQAHFLAVAEHGLVPARARNVTTQRRQVGISSVWAPSCQDVTPGSRARVGVVSRFGVPLSLPTILLFLRCGDSIPNLCKVPCSQCAHKSRSVVKCFQCSSVVDLSRQPLGPKETRVCHELSSASCYMVADGFGLILDKVDRAALGAAQIGDGTKGCSGECLDARTSGKGGSGTTSQRGSW